MSKEKLGQEPAFPTAEMGVYDGISKRLWIATQAPNFEYENPDDCVKEFGIEKPEWDTRKQCWKDGYSWQDFWFKCIAIYNFKYADAMLRQEKADSDE